MNNDPQKAQSYIQFGLKSLVPSYNIVNRIPSEDQIDSENTFYELLLLNAKIYKNLYVLHPSLSYLDTAMWSIDLAYIANDKLRKLYTDNSTKLISVANNKSLFNQSIDIVYTLYNESGDSKYITKAVELSDRSEGCFI